MTMQIRGSILLARKNFVCEHFGDEAWNEILGLLPAEDQTVLRSVIQVGWYAFTIGEHLDQAIVNELGKGDSSVFEAIGAKSAQDNLSGAHKAFLQPGHPQTFMKQAGQIYKFYYDVGWREYEPTGPDSGVLTTHEAETFSAVDCLTVIGWYKEALKMCGAKSVEMTETKCRAKGDDVCEYQVSWEI